MFNKKNINIFLLILFILLIISIICICIIIFYYNKIEYFENNNYLEDQDILLKSPNKDIETIYVSENIHENEIPLNIFMCWKNKNLSVKMSQLIYKIKTENPEFNIYIFDDNDCHYMLKKYFIKDVVDAFDTLIPGAFKADLWRYCVLYLYGGIYQDIKYEPINEFKYKELTDKEYFARDTDVAGKGVFNAIMSCKKNNKILEKAIKKIVHNVKTNFYGNTALDPTGPLLLKYFFSAEEINKFEIKWIGDKNDMQIFKNDRAILKMYPEYRDEQKKMSDDHNTKYYGDLWKERNIYKKN